MPPTLTRQPPHMPVPSTMIGLSETIVRTPSGRVRSATARIIGTGPDGVDDVDAAGGEQRP